MADGDSKRQRLFFALWPDGATRSRLGRLARSVVEQKRGREVQHSYLHLTLLYLGPVEETQFEQITLQVPCSLPQFTLQIDSAGFWRNPGVIWLGPSDPPDELMSLVESLTVAMRETGFDFDDRPFKPHITVMRMAVRGLGPVKIEPLEWRVERFFLMVSQSLPDGVTYRELKSWPLKNISSSSS